MKMYRSDKTAQRIQRAMPKRASKKNPVIEEFDKTGNIPKSPRVTAYTKAIPKKKKKKGNQLTGTAYAVRRRKYQIDKATK